jgi:hypothetical protein
LIWLAVWAGSFRFFLVSSFCSLFSLSFSLFDSYFDRTSSPSVLLLSLPFSSDYLTPTRRSWMDISGNDKHAFHFSSGLVNTFNCSDNAYFSTTSPPALGQSVYLDVATTAPDLCANTITGSTVRYYGFVCDNGMVQWESMTTLNPEFGTAGANCSWFREMLNSTWQDMYLGSCLSPPSQIPALALTAVQLQARGLRTSFPMPEHSGSFASHLLLPSFFFFFSPPHHQHLRLSCSLFPDSLMCAPSLTVTSTSSASSNGISLNFFTTSASVTFWYYNTYETGEVDNYVFRHGSSFIVGTMNIMVPFGSTLRCGYWHDDFYGSSPYHLAGHWVHIACTFEINVRVRRLYLNGYQIANDSTSYTLNRNTGFQLMGLSSRKQVRYFGLFRTLLTQSQIKTLADNPTVAWPLATPISAAVPEIFWIGSSNLDSGTTHNLDANTNSISCDVSNLRRSGLFFLHAFFLVFCRCAVLLSSAPLALLFCRLN